MFSPYMCSTSKMRLRLAVISLLQALPVQALIEPTTLNGTVAETSFVDPDLSKDILTQNFVEQHIHIPQDFIHKLNEFEDRLGIDPNSSHVDLRSGRVDSLTLAAPILPGDGYENHLLWSVDSKQDTAHTAPLTPDEWEGLAIQAVQQWMRDHASDLDIDVNSELFALGSVRTAVHGDGNMIQLHIPRTFKGVEVVGARAMATIKLGNLINVGFEDWGTIPPDMSVEPTLRLDDAYDALVAHTGRSIIRAEENCDAKLQILSMTPSSSNGLFGNGYDYVLVWRLCPIFEDQNVEAMEGLVDAHTGKIYSFIDLVHYFEAKGGVYPISNDKRNKEGTMSVPDIGKRLHEDVDIFIC